MENNIYFSSCKKCGEFCYAGTTLCEICELNNEPKTPLKKEAGPIPEKLIGLYHEIGSQIEAAQGSTKKPVKGAKK